MLHLIAAHQLLIDILSVPAGLAVAICITAIALRAYQKPVQPQLPAALLAALAADGPRHLLDETAVHTGDYEPRHASEYLPRHEADAAGTPVVLGAHPDGDITLVHADPAPEPAYDFGSEPTEERGALVGAAA
jgi:hypothetical protein